MPGCTVFLHYHHMWSLIQILFPCFCLSLTISVVPRLQQKVPRELGWVIWHHFQQLQDTHNRMISSPQADLKKGYSVRPSKQPVQPLASLPPGFFAVQNTCIGSIQQCKIAVPHNNLLLPPDVRRWKSLQSYFAQRKDKVSYQLACLPRRYFSWFLEVCLQYLCPMKYF